MILGMMLHVSRLLSWACHWWGYKDMLIFALGGAGSCDWLSMEVSCTEYSVHAHVRQHCLGIGFYASSISLGSGFSQSRVSLTAFAGYPCL